MQRAGKQIIVWRSLPEARNLRFYTELKRQMEDENSLNVLQSFLEQQCEIEPGIEFQRVHRIGKPQEDRSPRAITARFLTYGYREFIFSKVNKLKGTN